MSTESYAEIIAAGMHMAMCIRKASSRILFQHCTQGTALSNQNWTNREDHRFIVSALADYLRVKGVPSI